MSKTRNVAIYIFDDVELLDFCGPFEVFSVADRIGDDNPFNVFSVAQGSNTIVTKNGLSINAKYSIENCPKPDILLIPGGQGARKEMYNEVLLRWIKDCSKDIEFILSVCTGAFILARCGLLKDKKATTHHLGYEKLEELEPTVEVLRNKRFVDNGDIILSGGISAGIDMSLYVVNKLLGDEAVKRTVEHMEYYSDKYS